MSKQTMTVFMTPILPGKAGMLREPSFSNDELVQLFSKIGIFKYHRWIQKIHHDEFLIHQIESNDIPSSFHKLRELINSKDRIATELYQLYQDSLGVDLLEQHLIPNNKELTELITMGIQNENGALIKEYCFVYPIQPSKKQKLIDLYDDKILSKTYRDLNDYTEQVRSIYRSRGVSKNQLWIQEGKDGSFIVVYQEITGPVSEARDTYLNVRDNELAAFLAVEFSDITGLSFEELLPNLESLVDSEILR